MKTSPFRRRTALAVLILPIMFIRAIAQDYTTNSYTISNDEFANPERGFYIQANNYASSPSAVPNNLANYRINGKNSPGNTYNAKIALLLRLFYLNTFVNAPISAGYLNSIQSDFNSIRSQGCKAIVRFAYNEDQTRPFDEPSKARILEHIAQLKPLLQTNSDVIAVVQQGFIGAWGEGYYTDIFYTNGQAMAQHWLDRSEVITALLDALPPDRMIQVRVPQHKQKFVHGPTAPNSAAELDPSAAFSGTGAARIGFHNDCFLASADDYGTYADYDYGQGTTPLDLAALRNYTALDTRFTPMGGETCAVNAPTDDCASMGGAADSDMELFHYSYLNQSYNANVNDGWVAQGCIEEIKRRLGYRFQLASGIFRTEAQAGQALPLELQFQNVGFASPYNPRGMELVLRRVPTGEKYFAELSRDFDVRCWLPGTNHLLNTTLSLPSDIPVGAYELLLSLPDPAPSLYGLVPYSIRLANADAVGSGGASLGSVWEATTGYHRLGHTMTVNGAATNAVPSGEEIPVLSYSAVRETYETWKARHFALNPSDADPGLDPDHDGRKNLLEYAVGSNPNTGGEGAFYSVSLESNSLLLAVRKGPGTKDVQFAVESSSDPATGIWSDSQVVIVEDTPSRLLVSLGATNTSGFLRLRVALK